MVKVGLIGAGKMGISHLAILGATPNASVVGVAEKSSMILGTLKKYSSFPCFTDYRDMLEATNPDAVVVAVPTRLHESIVSELIERNIHTFVEKPFCIDPLSGKTLAGLAEKKSLVNQVGYHNRFIGTFQEAARLISGGFLGDLQHFSGNMNGPVVLKKNTGTWRSRPEEGGGCLMDYAAHLLDLIHFIVGQITNVNGVLIKTYYSNEVEDGVNAILETVNGLSGVISVNWSDETYRKMSTELVVYGTNGKLIVDATELKIYFKTNLLPDRYSKGWNQRNLNALTKSSEFYLRGEEYSLQLESFIESVQKGKSTNSNTFAEALKTDKAIEMIKKFKPYNYGQDSIWG